MCVCVCVCVCVHVYMCAHIVLKAGFSKIKSSFCQHSHFIIQIRNPFDACVCVCVCGGGGGGGGGGSCMCACIHVQECGD